MLKRIFRRGVARGALVVLAVLLVLYSWWGVARLDDGLIVKRFTVEGLPMRFIQPEGGQSMAGMIVAHGFGGSQQIMLGYGYAFARAGYGVMLLDFSGHAANPHPLSESGDALQADLDAAYSALLAQPGIDPGRVALLGHSMGSGAVMEAGIRHPERYAAVIAVSPTGADVTATLPPNLMLQAGSLEGRFIANAEQLLAQAGGASDDFGARTARRLVVIPNVEHISILFSQTSQTQALEWLASAFGGPPPSSAKDTRIGCYGLHLLGWVMLGLALAPLVQRRMVRTAGQPRPLRRWLAFFIAPLLATALLAGLASQIDLSRLLGLQVGGALGLWFLMMGLLWLGFGVRPGRLRLGSILRGLALFGVLWMGLGLMAQYTWMQWFLIPARLLRWPVLALACLPWKLAAGHALHGARGWKGVGLWLLQSLLLVGPLVAMAFTVPGMYVVVLIAPVLPLILGVEMLMGAGLKDPWGYAIGSALFLGWMMAAFFPLV
jgi:dienelactone hydrolase